VTTSNLSGAFTYGVVAGGVHTCGSFQSGAACWGEGGAGQLGTGNNLSSLVPTFLTLPDGVSALSANNQHSCAIILGAVSCWGAGDLNQLGQTGSQGGSSQPINVALP
jgi:serine/threonine-protein kinase